MCSPYTSSCLVLRTATLYMEMDPLVSRLRTRYRLLDGMWVNTFMASLWLQLCT